MIQNVAWFRLQPLSSRSESGDTQSDSGGSTKDNLSQIEAQLWDPLVKWCEARCLFVGGSLQGAVVYAAIAPLTPQQYRRLRAWLIGRLKTWLQANEKLGDFQMEMTEVGSLHLLGVSLAGIEAITQAQERLALHMADCALSLAAMAIPMRQRWRPSLSPQGDSFDLSLARTQLQIFISRQDRGPTAVFERYNGQTLGRDDLEGLIPELLSLHWRALESASDLSVGEWAAEHRDWRLNLCADPGSRLDHREVMRRWLVWLSAG